MFFFFDMQTFPKMLQKHIGMKGKGIEIIGLFRLENTFRIRRWMWLLNFLSLYI